MQPGNCIWIPSQSTWSLVDFGCTEQCGAHPAACAVDAPSKHQLSSAAVRSTRRAPIATGAERAFHECTDYRHMLAGKTVGLSFSLLYAAPETVAAFVNGKRAVVADSAVDTFAFGIMCYELLTRAPFYPKGLSGADVGDMLAGRREMPHETMSVDTERKLGTLKRCAAAHRFGFPR